MKAPQRQQQGGIITAQQTISGPLPAPEILKAYEQMTPGAMKIILDMAVKEQNANIELQKAAQATIERDNIAERNAEKRGQWMAFVLVCVSIASSFGLTLIGNSIAGIILAGAPLATVLTKIITRK